MNFEELKNIWNEVDQPLENALNINKDLLNEVSVNKINQSLIGINRTVWFELLVTIPFLFFLMDFFVDHFFDLPFMLSSLILIILMGSDVALNVYQMITIERINNSRSVLETQQMVENMRRLRRWDTLSLLVAIPLFSFPFIAVVVKHFTTMSLFALGDFWIHYSLGAAVVGMIIVFFLIRFPDKQLEESARFLREIKDMRKEG
ncbi:MAG: hypothetical protein AAFY71_15410 [Bacteroidota bacterium]